MLSFQLLKSLTPFLFAIILFSSCSDEPQTEAQVNDLPSDEAITTTIQTQLNETEGVPADSIQIAVENGVVTLSGSITNLLAKKRTTQIAEAVGGVLSVVNTLKVTASRPDKAVDEDVDEALSVDPVTENWEINTMVNNGMVTLKGDADSWQEKQLAATVVSGVRGVKGIKNAILVTGSEEEREAPDIKAEIESMIMHDARIGNGKLNIEVENGIVSLDGSVRSAAEKRVAIEKAHVAGVEKVVADRLEVDPELESRMFSEEMISSLSPKEIESAINRSFVYDPRVPADQVKVALEENVAVLSGSVNNLNSRLAAAADVRNTAGVDSVENNITVEHDVVVKPETPETDEAIKSRIKNAINRDPYVEEAVITINVDKGAVELAGDVNSEFEKEHIEEIVTKVKGIISIDNQLKVESESGSTT